MTVEVRKLRAPERDINEYTFEVSGIGEFPLDMLRYDRCHPKSQEDVVQVAASLAARPRPREPRSVTLTGPKAPTDARWQSFGWVVKR